MVCLLDGQPNPVRGCYSSLPDCKTALRSWHPWRYYDTHRYELSEGHVPACESGRSSCKCGHAD